MIDYSTIDLAELKKLPACELPHTYHLQERPGGNGCFLDPPGFPSYFTRSVYTRHGNNPRKGPEEVISVSEQVVEGADGAFRVTRSDKDWRREDTWDTVQARYQGRLRRLYRPLPFEHPRVQAWVAHLFQYFNHCYTDDAGKVAPPEYGRPGLLVYPLPYYKLRHFTDDPRFSGEWRAKEMAAVEQANADLEWAAREVAVFDNHRAVRHVREVYPDFGPDYSCTVEPSVFGDRARTWTAMTLIASPPERTASNWWERDAERPTPETCRPHGVLKEHNRPWCQFCGYETAEVKE